MLIAFFSRKHHLKDLKINKIKVLRAFYKKFKIIVEYVRNCRIIKSEVIFSISLLRKNIMKVRCDISGLDCPHCASKLEGLLKDAFNDANLNFSMGSLVLDVNDDADEDAVVEKAQSVANGFEDGINISLRD